jgi:hypothetical protein
MNQILMQLSNIVGSKNNWKVILHFSEIERM